MNGSKDNGLREDPDEEPGPEEGGGEDSKGLADYREEPWGFSQTEGQCGRRSVFGGEEPSRSCRARTVECNDTAPNHGARQAWRTLKIQPAPEDTHSVHPHWILRGRRASGQRPEGGGFRVESHPIARKATDG